MCNISYQSEFTRSNGTPSTVLGILSPQKQAVLNLVLGRNAVIDRKPNADQNIETMTFVVDIVVLGRDCGVAPSRSHIRS
jgi:hypothetical protein